MARPSRDTPIIIRKKKVTGHAHHGGAWKVAFADFMTAMFALFLVLWLVNQSADVKEAIANYFQDPIGFEQGGSLRLSVTSSDSRAPEHRIDAIVTGQRRGALNTAGDRIRRALQASPSLARVARNVKVEMTPEGLRIAIAEDEGATFFDSGSPILEQRAVEILALVAHELTSLPNPILVEGHTDARPLHRGDGYSNWELSTDRAHQARRLLIANGVDDARVQQVRGFADRDLLEPDAPLSPRNRRITITVLDAPAPAARGATPPGASAPAEPTGAAPADGAIAPLPDGSTASAVDAGATLHAAPTSDAEAP
jgi:chemotaxis protein MotB